MAQTRYTDGNDQAGNRLPGPRVGDFGINRTTGDIYQFCINGWKIVQKAEKPRRDKIRRR